MKSIVKNIRTGTRRVAAALHWNNRKSIAKHLRDRKSQPKIKQARDYTAHTIRRLRKGDNMVAGGQLSRILKSR